MVLFFISSYSSILFLKEQFPELGFYWILLI